MCMQIYNCLDGNYSQDGNEDDNVDGNDGGDDEGGDEGDDRPEDGGAGEREADVSQVKLSQVAEVVAELIARLAVR